MRICITGYRPSKLPNTYGYDLNNTGYKKLSQAIIDVLFVIAMFNHNKDFTLISGMALGVDQLYVKTAIKLKQDGYRDTMSSSCLPTCFSNDVCNASPVPPTLEKSNFSTMNLLAFLVGWAPSHSPPKRFLKSFFWLRS